MKTAIAIIDIQNDYFPGGRMELVGSDEAALKTARLLNAFRQKHWPIYHIQHISTQPGATFFLPGTPGADIFHAVRPLPTEPIISKHYPNSFRNTDLLEKLRADGIDNILVCGMMTHMCVDATVRAAFDFGFSCTVAHDACATRDLNFNGTISPAVHVHASFMAALGAVYAQIKGADDIINSIVRPV
jgi:nicotinamidase-related amidase